MNRTLQALTFACLCLAALAIAASSARAQVVYQEFTEAKASFGTNSLTIPTPAGAGPGDLLIAAVAADGNTINALAPPAGQGWLLIDLGREGGSVTLGVWWKLALASEPAAHTFTWSSNQEAYGWIMRFTGHDPVSPIHAVAAANGTSSAPPSPSVTTSIADALILRLGGFDDDDVSIDNPGLAGHVPITMDESGPGGGTTSGGAGYRMQVAPGPSGTSSFSLTGSEQYRTVTLAIVAGSAHLAIGHDGGANICQPESITLSAHDAAHAVAPGYLGTVGLSTSTGNGDWSLISGSGVLTNLGSGSGTYAFAAADAGTVTLGLANGISETLNIDATDGTLSESPAEDADLAFSAIVSTDMVRDEFNTSTYAGSDGSVAWSGSWIERDDDGSPSSGNVQVIAGEVSLDDFPNSGGDPSLEREADLTGASTATFSFDFRTTSGVDSSDSVFVEVSSNGGISWTILENITGISGATSGARSYDISPHIAVNTRVRFRVNGLNGTGGSSCCYGAASEQFLADNVQIQFASPLICGADHFTISHDGFGINCLVETLGVTARDSLGNVLTSYDQQITLDTQTGTGTWSLISGSGSFSDATSGDGLATYSFDPADLGSVVLGLSYEQGPATLDADVYETASPLVRDDDTEGALTFGPSGFTVTASALSNPPPSPIVDPIGTQIAGTDFALHLAAYGQTPDDPICGVIEAYAGAKALKFWSTYVDPGSGTRQVTIDGSGIATSEPAAAAQAVNFVSGQGVVLAKYKDVGRILIGLKDDAPPEPIGGIAGAAGPFVVKPADLLITAIERPDTSPNPGTSVPTDPDFFVTAGGPFQVTVEARDAEGDLTPSFGNETAAEGILLTASTLVAPAGGRNGSADDGAILNGTAFTPDGPAGRFSGTTFAWDEVGAMRLTASIADGDYLGAGDVTGTESGVVGRFIPDYFDVLPNAPAFRAGCVAGAFTYLEQPFDFAVGSEPVLSVTARALGGTTTRNYTGAWWRITNASLTGRSYTSLSGTLNPGGLPAPALDPAIVDLANGTGTLTFSTGAGLYFDRPAVVAPFDAEISLTINVVDLDGAAYGANPARFGTAAPGGGISFVGGKSMRFGRLALSNAHDSELVALAMPFVAEYWNGTGFVQNIADSCSAVPAAELSLAPTPPALVTVPTVGNVPLVLGDAGLSLSAPGAGNTGFVDVEADLSVTTGAGVPWLRYDWPYDGSDGLFDDNPIGRATFGIFPGDAPVVFMREVY
jgi:hypothetical protein